MAFDGIDLHAWRALARLGDNSSCRILHAWLFRRRRCSSGGPDGLRILQQPCPCQGEISSPARKRRLQASRLSVERSRDRAAFHSGAASTSLPGLGRFRIWSPMTPEVTNITRPSLGPPQSRWRWRSLLI